MSGGLCPWGKSPRPSRCRCALPACAKAGPDPAGAPPAPQRLLTAMVTALPGGSFQRRGQQRRGARGGGGAGVSSPPFGAKRPERAPWGAARGTPLAGRRGPVGECWALRRARGAAPGWAVRRGRAAPGTGRCRSQELAPCGGAAAALLPGSPRVAGSRPRKCPSAAGCPCPARIHLLPEEPPGRVPGPGVGHPGSTAQPQLWLRGPGPCSPFSPRRALCFYPSRVPQACSPRRGACCTRAGARGRGRLAVRGAAGLWELLLPLPALLPCLESECNSPSCTRPLEAVLPRWGGVACGVLACGLMAWWEQLGVS